MFPHIESFPLRQRAGGDVADGSGQHFADLFHGALLRDDDAGVEIQFILAVFLRAGIACGVERGGHEAGVGRRRRELMRHSSAADLEYGERGPGSGEPYEQCTG